MVVLVRTRGGGHVANLHGEELEVSRQQVDRLRPDPDQQREYDDRAHPAHEIPRQLVNFDSRNPRYAQPLPPYTGHDNCAAIDKAGEEQNREERIRPVRAAKPLQLAGQSACVDASAPETAGFDGLLLEGTRFVFAQAAQKRDPASKNRRESGECRLKGNLLEPSA